MLRPKKQSNTDYLDELELPADWEELRDEEGDVVEGCYRTLPAPDSDSL